MPSAFAMFASAPPASAGSAAAAPGATDSETASLFSSNLADAIQGVKADAAKAEAAHRTPGRLSLPVISSPEMEAAGTSDASPALAEAVDVAPDALIAGEAPTSDAAPDTEQTDTPVAPSDLAAAPQPPLPQSAPVAAPIVTPTTASEPSLETAAAEDASVGQATAVLEQGAAAGVTVEPSAQQNATAATETALVEARPAPSPIPDAPAQTPINGSAETSAHEQSPAPNHETAAAAPVAPDVDQTLAGLAAQQVHAAASSPPVAKDDVTTKAPLPESGMTGQASADVKNASASAPDKSAVAADASIVKPAEKAATKPVSEPVQSAGASAVSPKIETAAPKMDVKVSIQSANLAAQPVQTVAVISSLAVAEAVQAIDAKVEVPTEPSDTGSAPVIATSQPTESAPAKAATTPVTNAAQPNPASTKPAPAPAEASQGQNVAQPALGDHIAMADATPPPAQNAASTEAAPTGTVPVLDAAMTSLDPATPVDGATEARALDAATTTTQTTSPSSLSRATVETTAHLAAQIARKLEGRSTRFDMVLTPEDLGRVDVSLEIGADGRLAARLAFDNPAAAAELRGRADELRRQLQDAGFQLASDSLDFTQRDTSSGGGFDRQQQQHQSLFARGARLTAQADLSIAQPQGAWTNHSQTRDRVDVRV
ncbi:flagellar hook-length control protein FliK [Brevundimonas sp. TSRC1-1]|uniref:flagellar hook-length control protein FliK n=1 Tax=Brevundimonas sp. TSRC1-1 TaxID=2804562 RepID=UPI003CF9B715